MRTRVILATALLVAVPGAVVAQDQAKGAEEGSSQKERKVCRIQTRTGSLVRRERICRTPEEWNRESELIRSELDRMDRLQQRNVREGRNPMTGEVIQD